MSLSKPQVAPVAGSGTGKKEWASGYVLWEFTGQAWEIKKDASAPGAMPSQPPVAPGKFVGQIRATASVATSV
jgi:hypothetical protein